jgi:hypothetical protein
MRSLMALSPSSKVFQPIKMKEGDQNGFDVRQMAERATRLFAWDEGNVARSSDTDSEEFVRSCVSHYGWIDAYRNALYVSMRAWEEGGSATRDDLDRSIEIMEEYLSLLIASSDEDFYNARAEDLWPDRSFRKAGMFEPPGGLITTGSNVPRTPEDWKKLFARSLGVNVDVNEVEGVSLKASCYWAPRAGEECYLEKKKSQGSIRGTSSSTSVPLVYRHRWEGLECESKSFEMVVVYYNLMVITMKRILLDYEGTNSLEDPRAATSVSGLAKEPTPDCASTLNVFKWLSSDVVVEDVWKLYNMNPIVSVRNKSKIESDGSGASARNSEGDDSEETKRKRNAMHRDFLSTASDSNGALTSQLRLGGKKSVSLQKDANEFMNSTSKESTLVAEIWESGHVLKSNSTRKDKLKQIRQDLRDLISGVKGLEAFYVSKFPSGFGPKLEPTWKSQFETQASAAEKDVCSGLVAKYYVMSKISKENFEFMRTTLEVILAFVDLDAARAMCFEKVYSQEMQLKDKRTRIKNSQVHWAYFHSILKVTSLNARNEIFDSTLKLLEKCKELRSAFLAEMLREEKISDVCRSKLEVAFKSLNRSNETPTLNFYELNARLEKLTESALKEVKQATQTAEAISKVLFSDATDVEEESGDHIFSTARREKLALESGGCTQRQLEEMAEWLTVYSDVSEMRSSMKRSCLGTGRCLRYGQALCEYADVYLTYVYVLQESFMKSGENGANEVTEANGLKFLNPSTFPPCCAVGILKGRVIDDRGREDALFNVRSKEQVRWLLNVVCYIKEVLENYRDTNKVYVNFANLSVSPVFRDARYVFFRGNVINKSDCELWVNKFAAAAVRCLSSRHRLSFVSSTGSMSGELGFGLDAGIAKIAKTSVLSPAAQTRSFGLARNDSGAILPFSLSNRPTSVSGAFHVESTNAKIYAALKFLLGSLVLTVGGGDGTIGVGDLLTPQQRSEDLMTVCCIYYVTNGGMLALEQDVMNHDERKVKCAGKDLRILNSSRSCEEYLKSYMECLPLNLKKTCLQKVCDSMK